MDSEDVQITLKRVYNDLDRIFKSRGWLQILNATQEPSTFENSLGNALFYATEAKLKVSRLIEQRRRKEADLCECDKNHPDYMPF